MDADKEASMPQIKNAEELQEFYKRVAPTKWFLAYTHFKSYELDELNTMLIERTGASDKKIHTSQELARHHVGPPQIRRLRQHLHGNIRRRPDRFRV